MTLRTEPPETWQQYPATERAVKLRAFLRERKLTGVKAAGLVGVDLRTIRKWSAGERAMPYSAWYCLVHRALSTPSSAAGLSSSGTAARGLSVSPASVPSAVSGTRGTS